MGFTPNKSDEKVFREIKLYTGLHNMKVFALNPSKEQLEEMGYKPKEAPVYITKEGKVTKLRLDFHLIGKSPDGDKIMSKVAFFLEDQYRTNRDATKSEWINDFGRTAWSGEGSPDEPPTGLTWFDSSTARRSHVGEADLHSFLVNWLNIGPKDEAKMENFKALFAGDYSELQGLMAGNSDNEIRVLLTVRDSKYQSIYNRYFDRASNRRTNYWDNHIKNQVVNGYPIKEDYSNSLIFKEWVEGETTTDSADTGEDKPKGDDPF